MINEDILQALTDKMEGVSDLSWGEIVDELELNISPETLRKAFSCSEFGGYAMVKYMQDNGSGYASDEQIEKFEKIKDETYKERCKLQDANREKRNQLREEARFENLVEVLRDRIEDLEPIVLSQYVEKNNDGSYASAQWSDWHIGQIADNPWNYYDMTIAKERANQLVDKTIEKIKLHNIKHLTIEIGGDMTEGLINVTGRVDSEEDTISQIVYVSELLAQCINKIKEYCEVRIVTVLGNHGRLGGKKDFAIRENFERLIPEFLKLRLNMPIHSSQGLDFTAYETDGRFICVTHGQYDSIKDVIEDYSKIYKRVPDEIHMGHYHEYSDKSDGDVRVTVNGSLPGTGDFSLQCKSVSKASQNLIIYNPDRCIYPLELD